MHLPDRRVAEDDVVCVGPPTTLTPEPDRAERRAACVVFGAIFVMLGIGGVSSAQKDGEPMAMVVPLVFLVVGALACVRVPQLGIRIGEDGVTVYREFRKLLFHWSEIERVGAEAHGGALPWYVFTMYLKDGSRRRVQAVRARARDLPELQRVVDHVNSRLAREA